MLVDSEGNLSGSGKLLAGLGAGVMEAILGNFSHPKFDYFNESKINFSNFSRHTDGNSESKIHK